jgi:hypothetical protein
LRFAQHKSRHRVDVATLGDFSRPGSGGLKFEDTSGSIAFAAQPPAQKISQCWIFYCDNYLTVCPPNCSEYFHKIQRAIVIDVLHRVIK